MARNQIRVALWEYLTADGKRRLAYFGDSVELTPTEYERAEKAGVFDAVATEAASVATAVDGEPSAAAVVVPRPAKAHAKELWVEYAVSKGWDRAVAEDTNKKDLVAALAEDGDEDPDTEATAVNDVTETKADADQDPVEMAVPKKAALLEEWQEYARHKGLSDKDIEGLERQELIQLLT